MIVSTRSSYCLRESYAVGYSTPLYLPRHTHSDVCARNTTQLRAARVGGVDIPEKKLVEASLQYVYGVGRRTAKKILVTTGVSNKRTFDLDDDDLLKLRAEVDKYTIEGDLRRYNAMNIKRLKEIGCYRGRRHVSGLPVNGQ